MKKYSFNIKFMNKTFLDFEKKVKQINHENILAAVMTLIKFTQDMKKLQIFVFDEN